MKNLRVPGTVRATDVLAPGTSLVAGREKLLALATSSSDPLTWLLVD